MLTRTAQNSTSCIAQNIQYFENPQQYPDWVNYSICDIQLDTQDIVLYNIAENFQYTCKLIQALSDDIVDGLIQKESAYLGFNIGKVMHCLISDSNNNPIKRFQLKENHGLYRLIYSRMDGSVCFLDRVTRQEINLPALTVIQNNFLLEQFDPTDICQIGMTAGVTLTDLLLENPSQTEDAILQSFRYRSC